MGALSMASGIWAEPVALAQTPWIVATDPQSIGTIAGTGTAGSSGDGGTAVNAELDRPTGLAEDLTGAIYIADSHGNQIRRVTNPTVLDQDIISTFAGNGTGGFEGDGGPAALAELNFPTGLATDTSGDVFIADTGNNRVREVVPSGQIQTFAGIGRCSRSTGDGGPALAASLCRPTGVAVDGATVYIADSGHDEVRAVNAGVISDFLGTSASLGDDNFRHGEHVRLASPSGLAVNALHDVFIADTGHDRVVEVFPSGTVITIAGKDRTDTSDSSGGVRFSRPTRLDHPTGLAVDPNGNLYIADTGNNRLLMVDLSGQISTVAGTGRAGFSGDGGPATKAQLNHPTGVVADAAAVYFADTRNERVRGVFSGPPPVLPEGPSAILLPIAAGVVAGGALLIVLRRRRHQLKY
jgi:sugar lactone lactonase YvrE